MRKVTKRLFAANIPEQLFRWAIDQALDQFSIYGSDPEFKLELGAIRLFRYSPGWTPTRIVEMDTSEVREITLRDSLP